MAGPPSWVSRGRPRTYQSERTDALAEELCRVVDETGEQAWSEWWVSADEVTFYEKSFRYAVQRLGKSPFVHKREDDDGMVQMAFSAREKLVRR